jgi:hypothetical protein
MDKSSKMSLSRGCLSRKRYLAGVISVGGRAPIGASKDVTDSATEPSRGPALRGCLGSGYVLISQRPLLTHS